MVDHHHKHEEIKEEAPADQEPLDLIITHPDSNEDFIHILSADDFEPDDEGHADTEAVADDDNRASDSTQIIASAAE
jgi:hypothetical protein